LIVGTLIVGTLIVVIKSKLKKDVRLRQNI